MTPPIGVAVLRRLSPFNFSPRTRNRLYRLSVLVLTFCCYTSYHLSRKAISVVKSTWHPKNCTHVKQHLSPVNASYRDRWDRDEDLGAKAAENDRFDIAWAASPWREDDELSMSHNDSHSNDSHCSCCWKPFTTSSSLGDMDFTFLLCYAVAMFVMGHIGDRYNLRHFLFIGMTSAGVFTALLGLPFWTNTHSFAYFISIQVLGGIAQSTGWPSVVAVMGNWFGKGNRGLLMGIWNAHTSVGNILGSVISGFWDSTYSWGWAFIVPGAIIFGAGVLILLFLVVHPEDVNCDQPQHRDANHPLAKESAPLLGEKDHTNRTVSVSKSGRECVIVEKKALSVWGAMKIPGVAEFAFCLFFAKFVSYIFLFWLPVYINDNKVAGKSINSERAADYSTLFDVGGILGGILAGIISDRGGTRALTCTAMLILAVPALWLFRQYGGIDLAHLLGLMIVAGVMVNGPYALITTAVSADLGNHELLQGNQKAKATVAAIIDGTGSFGAALGPYVTGQGLQHASWNVVIYICMACSFVAAVLLTRLCIKEVRSLLALVDPTPDNRLN